MCVGGGDGGRGVSMQKVEARGPYLGASTNLLSASLPELHMLSFSVCTENCDK